MNEHFQLILHQRCENYFYKIEIPSTRSTHNFVLGSLILAGGGLFEVVLYCTQIKIICCSI